MSPGNIGCRRTLRITILAIVKAVLGFGRHTERSAKAIALYIGATAEWARIKLGVTHVSNPALRAKAPAGQSYKRSLALANGRWQVSSDSGGVCVYGGPASAYAAYALTDTEPRIGFRCVTRLGP
jgi:hypothetical protein